MVIKVDRMMIWKTNFCGFAWKMNGSPSTTSNSKAINGWKEESRKFRKKQYSLISLYVADRQRKLRIGS